VSARLKHIAIVTDNVALGRNSQLAPRQIDIGPEGEVRLRPLATCRYGQLQV
jgi:hypothetical protein